VFGFFKEYTSLKVNKENELDSEDRSETSDVLKKSSKEENWDEGF
jgi:hypothetical protein